MYAIRSYYAASRDHGRPGRRRDRVLGAHHVEHGRAGEQRGHVRSDAAGIFLVLAFLFIAGSNLQRVGTYASPASLLTKDCNELILLRQKKLRILYFGLESGDPATLAAINKGFSAEEMLIQCRKAQQRNNFV